MTHGWRLGSSAANQTLQVQRELVETQRFFDLWLRGLEDLEALLLVALFHPKGIVIVKTAIPIGVSISVPQTWRSPAFTSLHTHDPSSIAVLEVQAGHGAVV